MSIRRNGTHLTEEAKQYLRSVWNDRCAYCGGGWSQIDHVVPYWFGQGTRDVFNFALSCENCNASKRNMFVEEFLAGQNDVLARVLGKGAEMRGDPDLPSGQRKSGSGCVRRQLQKEEARLAGTNCPRHNP
jgi:hypothetical protein